MNPSDLHTLAKQYGTDKLLLGYIPFYERLFRDRAVKRLVEIGVFWGYSVQMWEAFFPEAEIIGLDNEHRYDAGRIKTIVCDQSSQQSLSEAALKIGPGIDVVIDDGSHVVDDQVLTAKTLLPLVSTTGAYVIEDVHQKDVGLLISRLGLPCEVLSFPHHPYNIVSIRFGGQIDAHRIPVVDAVLSTAAST